MPRQKKQQLKRRKDGRFCCKYKGIQFMGGSSDEALALREEYKQLEKADDIAARIEEHEKNLMEKLRNLFGDK